MDAEKIKSELQYKAVRSSGAGGQNVNKVASKVILSFDINNSKGLSEEEKNRIKIKLAPRLTTDFILILNGEEDLRNFKSSAFGSESQKSNQSTKVSHRKKNQSQTQQFRDQTEQKKTRFQFLARLIVNY